jgi:hypothetical protein
MVGVTFCRFESGNWMQRISPRSMAPCVVCFYQCMTLST